MEKLGKFIVKARYQLLAIFAILTIVSAFLMTRVKINYDLTNYLDSDSSSSISLKIMEKEFGAAGQCQYMVSGDKDTFDFDAAQKLQGLIQEDDGVSSVVFASDESDEDYFKELDGKNYALYKIFLTTGNFENESYDTLDRIDKIINNYEIETDVSRNGSAVTNDFLTSALDKDMVIIIIVVVVIVLIILALVSTSWIEPLIFGIIVAGSILINLGSNIILNYIPYINNSMSFITKSIAAVMQLALSMDYAIVLLHTYREMKETYSDKKEAMAKAVARSFAPVSSSSLTTVAGLVALMFMSFTIGFDVGLVLAKGIVISLLCVFLFMPSILLIFDKLLVKTTHKSIDQIIIKKNDERVAKGKALGKEPFTLAKYQSKTRIIIPAIISALILFFAVISVRNSDYSFSLRVSKNDNDTVNVEDEEVTDVFGTQNTMVIMIPKDKYSYELETKITNYLENYKYEDKTIVNSIQGIASTGISIPLTKEQCATNFGLPLDTVNDVYQLMYVNDKDHVVYDENTNTIYVTADNIIRFLLNNKNEANKSNVVLYTLKKQAEVDNTFNSFKSALYDENGLVNETALNGMKNVVSTYETAQASDDATKAAYINALMTQTGAQSEEELALIYANYKKLTTIVDRNAVKSSYTFIQDDTLNVIFKDTDTKYVFEIIAFISEYQIIASYGENLEAILTQKFQSLKSLSSENYYRMIINLDCEMATSDSFKIINEMTDELYDGENFKDSNLKIVGETFVYSEIRDVFNRDMIVVNLISFIAILVIIAFTFKSWFIPMLLTVLIQGAIWITMGISPIMNHDIYFVCYLVVMCVQMGATIDYAILITSNYVLHRKENNKLDAMSKALKSSLMTIITSGTILILSTLIIGLVSKVSIISELGLLLTRGCLISVLLVIFCLPQFILLCDKIIEKTTYKAKFYNGASVIDASANEANNSNELESADVKDNNEESKEDLETSSDDNNDSSNE